MFSTRIAYITKQGPRYQLLVADADGNDPQSVVASNEPLLSPRWSPDGTRLAYVSFENKKPVVYVQSLETGERRAVANFRGSNSSPAWSPDGRRLAVTLTKDGGSQVYLMNADGSNVTRVLTSPGIDTEAMFTPDGQSLVVHVRSRRHAADLPRAACSAGQVERLTFDGSYNVSPRPLPDGKGIVFVRRDGGRFQIATLDYATRQVQVLTSGPGDESPSVAPERQARHLRERRRRPRHSGRGIHRRSREAAARRAREPTCASPRGDRFRGHEHLHLSNARRGRGAHDSP